MKTNQPKRRVYRGWMKVRKPNPPAATSYRILRNQNTTGRVIIPVSQNSEGKENASPLPPASAQELNDTVTDPLQGRQSENDVQMDEELESTLNSSISSQHSCSTNSSVNSDISGGSESNSSTSNCDNLSHISSTTPLRDNDYEEDNAPHETPVLNDREPNPFQHPKQVDFLDSPVHESLSVTKFDVVLMIINFAFRHGLTGVAIEDLSKMINCMLGCESIPVLTKYWLTKVFGSVTYDIHFYCSACECYIGKISSVEKRLGSRKCPITTCGTICNYHNLNDGNFFVTLPIRDQLKHLLENTDDILNLLEYRWTRTAESGTIGDVYDGLVYKNLSSEGNILSEKYNLSVTCNTDGAVVFNSVKNTLYPIHLRINELPPNVRFDHSNSLLAGLYFGKKEPNMALFLAPFVQEMKELYETGVAWNPSPQVTITSRVVLIQCVLDSVAKPKVQNMNQFNGAWSCGYCLHPGVVLDYIPSNHSKFLMNNDVYMFEDLSLSYTVTKCVGKNREQKTFHVYDRDDAMVRKDMEDAEEKRKSTPATLRNNVHVRGLKGISALNRLSFFDMSYGFQIDYMHCVLLGCCRTLTTLLCDNEGYFYIGDDKVKEIENKLSTICPPSSISRRPRPLSEMAHWHANEWRSWLLYYSLCCLRGSIPQVNFRHYSLLVSASFILLGTSISINDIKKASWYLVQFVSEYSNIYGEPNVFYNVHLLLHLGKMVLHHGPWWCYSAFSFESSNGSLIRLVKGTKCVTSQIVEKYGICKLLPQTLALYKVSDSVLEYCEDLLCYRNVKISDKIGNSSVLGEQTCVRLKPHEIAAFHEAELEPSDFSYQRFVKNGVMYHATCYSRRGLKSDDSVVRLRDNHYGTILRIIKSTNTVGDKIILLLLRRLNIAHNTYVVTGRTKAEHIKCCSATVYGPTVFYTAEDIAAKAILMKCGHDTFVTDFPNIYEKD